MLDCLVHDETPKPTLPAASIAARKTYWAHDPYRTKGTDNARMAEISQVFMKLFEEGMHARHCRMVTGVEIEGSVDTGRDRGDELERSIAYVNKEIGYANRETGRKSGIYRAYKDQGDFEVVTWPLKPREAVAYTKKIKQILTESTEEFAALAPDQPLLASARKLRDVAQWKKFRFGDVDMEMRGQDRKFYGEHINISLHATDSKVSSRHFDLAADNVTPAYQPLMTYVLSHCLVPDYPLLMTHPASKGRVDFYESLNAEHIHINNDNSDKGGKLRNDESKRTEWRLPDSASDIHQSMLAAQAAMYAIVSTVTDVLGTDRIPYRLTGPEEGAVRAEIWDLVAPIQQARLSPVERFHNHSLVLQMMDKVKEDRVPVQEWPKYEAMIEEFSALAVRQYQANMGPEASFAR